MSFRSVRCLNGLGNRKIMYDGKIQNKIGDSNMSLLRSRAPLAPAAVYIVRDSSSAQLYPDERLTHEAVPKATDVIDLGAPRLPARLCRHRKSSRPRFSYTPNPRLYPGPQTKPKPCPKRSEALGSHSRGRRHKRVFRRPVPNARLYRPAPPPPPPPPAWPPRDSWPVPTPPAQLDTASRVALRLSEQRRPISTPQRRSLWAPRLPLLTGQSLVRAERAPVRAERAPVRAGRGTAKTVRSPVRSARSPGKTARSPVQQSRQLTGDTANAAATSRRLVVTLPAPFVEPAQHYCPARNHFRLHSLDSDSGTSTPAARLATARAPAHVAPGLIMDAANRHSTSPEDCSESNEPLSAPSEFLAEFLSAIMRRQYAEALKYCRLILQYEPHNATARGFYPLLQHKVQAHKLAEQGGWARGSSSEEPSAHADKPKTGEQEMMELGADEWEVASRSSSRSRGSCASQSSLELDSSDAPAHSSPSVSLSASAGAWDSTGSASRSEPDDNGNALAPPAPPTAPAAPLSSDLHNDNVDSAPHKTESAASSLGRLRAQFTCSIK